MSASQTKFRIETERLFLREITRTDFPVLRAILQDPEVMTAYEGAFSERETADWLEWIFECYHRDKIGLWAAVLRENGRMIGQCGLTYQDWKGRKVLEIGYLFQKAYWHKGYATECAAACGIYAFGTMKANAVYSIIRDTNRASQKVAERNGMTVSDRGIKHYRGIDMPHLLYKRGLD